MDVLTVRSLSPEWEGSPHGEAELIHDGDFEELSKQLEKERYIDHSIFLVRTYIHNIQHTHTCIRELHTQNVHLHIHTAWTINRSISTSLNS